MSSKLVLVIVIILIIDGCSALLTNVPRKALPDKIIVGYANWMECDEKLITAVSQGVNVLIWFSINLMVNPSTGAPIVTGGPNRTCVKAIQEQIRELGLDTTHLISIGGWNSPHPDTSNSAGDVFREWVSWNDGLYDGFDWDIEGNDDPASQYNHFTMACLDLMGEMSQLAKASGFIVSMAPAESYLDMTTSVFDLDLNHSYPEWSTYQPNFNYHGHNVYAYLLAKFSKTKMVPLLHGDFGEESSDSIVVDTFDFITVQLYEGYSHAEYNTSISMQSAADYVIKFVRRMSAGWLVDFGEFIDSSQGPQLISVPPSKLVVGLANGWAGDGKFILIYPDELAIAYRWMVRWNIIPRGFAFWDIADEGKASQQRPEEPVWLAAGLNTMLHTRP